MTHILPFRNALFGRVLTGLCIEGEEKSILPVTYTGGI